MVGNLQTSMFLLYAFVLPVNPIDPVMALVNVCPKNEIDVIQASNRLGCGKDKYGTIQYLCLPNKKKTSLIEFCYQGVMGFMEKGNCIEFSKGKWIFYNCNHFLNGCPENDLEVFEIYKYPACQNINKHLQCYVMDKNCTAESDTGESSDQNNFILITCISIGVILFVISCIITIFFYKRRRANRNKKKGDTDMSSDEAATFLSEKGDQEKVTDKTTTPVSVADAYFPKSSKLPFYMEKETVESMLNRQSMGDCIETFKKEDLDLSLLLELSEHDLKNTLGKINLTQGKQVKIDREIKAMQSRIHSWRGQDIRMVMIGTVGSGKSATADTILGKTLSLRRSNVTSECVKKHAIRFDQKICIVDTPGICKFDTIHTNAKIQNEILKCITMLSPGPHAIVLVTSVTRHTEDEPNFIHYFKDLFGEHFFKFLIILFTRKDYFDNKRKSLEGYIKSLPLNLQADIAKCGERVITFSDKLKGKVKEDKVKELLSMIINNVENYNDCYNSEMYMEAEKRLHEREAEIREKEKMERDKNVGEANNRLKNKTM